jgi:hypothetical protein
MHGWDTNVVVSFNAHFQCMGLHHKKEKATIFAEIKMGKRKERSKAWPVQNSLNMQTHWFEQQIRASS